jgi:DNA modification methylase
MERDDMIHQGDCLDILKGMKSNSVDSLVTDPPAGISFMGKEWDEDKGGRKQWIAWMSEVMSECKRVLKPGAHALVWAIPRTSHWTATALEDAGFEIRDVVTHIFGSGFPKSLDISKAIDKAAGAEREVVGPNLRPDGSFRVNSNKSEGSSFQSGSNDKMNTAPATNAAKQWQGFGTALKPASEHWILCRKPLSEKTVAANVLLHGTGGINVDASRIDAGKEKIVSPLKRSVSAHEGWQRPWNSDVEAMDRANRQKHIAAEKAQTQGRFPSNLVLSHNEDCVEVGTKSIKLNGSGKCSGNTTKDKSMFGIGSHELSHGKGDGTETVSAFECTPGCAVAMLDEQSGVRPSSRGDYKNPNKEYKFGGLDADNTYANETGGASRFFKTFQSNANKPSSMDPDFATISIESDQGSSVNNLTDDCSCVTMDTASNSNSCSDIHNSNIEQYTKVVNNNNSTKFVYCAKASKKDKGADNTHPTVKSSTLMSYLIRMITTPGGTVLDPFMGSGSTGVAAKHEGFSFIGIEQNKEYVEIAKKRIYSKFPLFKKQYAK